MSSSSSGGSALSSSSSSSSLSSSSVYDMIGLPGGYNTAAASSSSTTSLNHHHHHHHQNQGMASLLVMLAVLCFILAYCCWGAPFCRSLCRRYCYCCCCCFCSSSRRESQRQRQPNDQSSSTTLSESGGFVTNASSTTRTNAVGRRAYHEPSLGNPTIILLPHGRMLVVDGTIFTQLQADSTGLDFVELGESVMRAQRNPGGNCRQLQTSQASIIEMDAETPSKDSMGSVGCFPPPTYESIYGKDEQGDMPPSYSDILLHRLANLPFEIEDYSRDSKEERSSLENCARVIGNPFATHNEESRRASSSSNERNYSSLPRNPSSLQINPLDAYFVHDELAASRNQRRRSATALTNCARRTSCEEDSPSTDLRTNDIVVGRSENVIDDRPSNSWDQISIAANEASSNEVEQRLQHSSRVTPVYVSSRRSTTTHEDEAIQVHRYPEARYISDEELSAGDDDIAADEEANNFKVLADIRESRV